MSDKFKGNENCEYCGEKIEGGNRNKRFCSTRCRVYFNRENKKSSVEIKELAEQTKKYFGDNLIKEKDEIPIDSKKKKLEQLISDINPRGLGIKKQPEPPAGLTGIDLTIWKKENLK